MDGFWKNEQISPLFLCKLRMADTTFEVGFIRHDHAHGVGLQMLPHEPMKNTENADRPMSAMLYFPSRHWPLRRSGRPAQASFSSEIRQAKAFTPASSQRHRRAASQYPHSRCDETNSATCCQSDSVRRGSEWRGATRCESVALRTAGAVGPLW